jgi:hypothetical protein
VSPIFLIVAVTPNPPCISTEKSMVVVIFIANGFDQLPSNPNTSFALALIR